MPTSISKNDMPEQPLHHFRFHARHAHLSSPFGNDWFGIRAEGFARFFGTPGFLMAQTVVVAIWIVLNATGVTHLFNAMPPFSARDPGIVGTALSEPRLTAGLIVDGIHVDPVSVRTAFAAKGADRIALVTDAMPTVGTSLDRFNLVGRAIKLVNGRLTTEEGTLAGAHLDMASAVRNAVRLAKVPLEDALRAASLTPAQFLGIENERGAIVPGARADLVALTDTLTVAATWIDGEIESYDVP